MIDKIEIRQFDKSDKDRWDLFVESSNEKNFLYTRAFLDYHGERFNDNSLVIMDKNGVLIGILPAAIVEKKFISHPGLPYAGLLVHEKISQTSWLTMIDAVNNFVTKTTKCEAFIYKLKPKIFRNSMFEEESIACSKQLLLDRSTGINSYIDYKLGYKFSKGRRHSVKKGKNADLKYQNIKLTSEFWALQSHVLETNHGVQPTHSLEDMLLIEERFPENIDISIVTKNDQTVAGCVLFLFDNVAHTQYMFNTEIGRNISALDYLMSCNIEIYSGQKSFFSFGVSTINNGEDINYGLMRQKEAFGAGSGLNEIFTWKIE